MRSAWLAGMAVLSTAATGLVAAVELRAMTVDDLFTVETLAETAVAPVKSLIAAVVVRPRTKIEAYPGEGPLAGRARSDIWIVHTDGGVPRNLTHGVADGRGYWRPVWSPRGEQLAFFCIQRSGFIGLFIWDRSANRLRQIPEADLSADILQWIDDNRLIVLKQRSPHAGMQSSVSVWDSDPDAAPIPQATLLAVDARSLETAPLAQLPMVGPNSADRSVNISPSGRYAAVLAQSQVIPQPRRSQIDWRWTKAQLQVIRLRDAQAIRKVDLEIKRYFDVASGLELCGAWSSEDDFAVIEADASVLQVSGRTGEVRHRAMAGADAEKFVWGVRPCAQTGMSSTPPPAEMLERVSQALSLNKHFDAITEGERRLIEYRSADGTPLKAILLLPVSYREDRRYPLIAWVYARAVFTDTSYFMLNKINGNYLNLQLLAAQGYAVLLPSIPLTEGSSDPFIDIPKGVMPAIDKAIDLGIADADRLAVMGHSYGGYTVYALLAHTQRFKAAVALAGLANIVSAYGQFDTRMRRDDSPLDYMSTRLSASNASGDPGKGQMPYENRWFWERNNPINYADRLHTPLLIVQGDMDHVALQQGEEMFTALYRQGRPVRFVRYWGEGHTIESPEHIKDLWQRIYAWLDERLH